MLITNMKEILLYLIRKKGYLDHLYLFVNFLYILPGKLFNLMRYDEISFIFVISKVDLVRIESNDASIDQLKPGNFGHPKPLEAPLESKSVPLEP